MRNAKLILWVIAQLLRSNPPRVLLIEFNGYARSRFDNGCKKIYTNLYSCFFFKRMQTILRIWPKIFFWIIKFCKFVLFFPKWKSKSCYVFQEYTRSRIENRKVSLNAFFFFFSKTFGKNNFFLAFQSSKSDRIYASLISFLRAPFFSGHFNFRFVDFLMHTSLSKKKISAIYTSEKI